MAGELRIRTCRHGQSIVIRAQTEKEEQGGQPHAQSKEGRDFGKSREVNPNPVMPVFACGLGETGKVVEPSEVVCDNADTGRDEGDGGEVDYGPCVGEILEVDQMAED